MAGDRRRRASRRRPPHAAPPRPRTERASPGHDDAIAPRVPGARRPRLPRRRARACLARDRRARPRARAALHRRRRPGRGAARRWRDRVRAVVARAEPPLDRGVRGAAVLPLHRRVPLAHRGARERRRRPLQRDHGHRGSRSGRRSDRTHLDRANSDAGGPLHDARLQPLRRRTARRVRSALQSLTSAT